MNISETFLIYRNSLIYDFNDQEFNNKVNNFTSFGNVFYHSYLRMDKKQPKMFNSMDR